MPPDRWTARSALSEHAHANAIDMGGFRLADGRMISVCRLARLTPESAFLHDIRNGGCRHIPGVLSPDYNRAHANHLHFDMGETNLPLAARNKMTRLPAGRGGLTGREGTVMDFARARDIMVETQVRTNDVTDPRSFKPYARCHANASSRRKAHARLRRYRGGSRPGAGADAPPRPVQAATGAGADVNARALEIAGATGYGAAVLACAVDQVIALDPDPDLSFAANAALESCGLKNVKAVSARASAAGPTTRLTNDPVERRGGNRAGCLAAAARAQWPARRHSALRRRRLGAHLHQER